MTEQNPQNPHNPPTPISRRVLWQLNQIRESAAMSMGDFHGVHRAAYNAHYYELVSWMASVDGDAVAYVNGLSQMDAIREELDAEDEPAEEED